MPAAPPPSVAVSMKRASEISTLGSNPSAEAAQGVKVATSKIMESNLLFNDRSSYWISLNFALRQNFYGAETETAILKRRKIQTVPHSFLDYVDRVAGIAFHECV